MRHPTPRQFSGVLLGALAVMALQGCKRTDMVTAWTPAGLSSAAYLEDSVLTSRVRRALLISPVVNSFNIGVESHQGVVLLSGMAANSTQIDLAVFVAQTVPGVSSVDSFMFSTSVRPVLAIDKSHTPDPGALRAPRLLDNTPFREAADQEGEGPPSAQAHAEVPLSHPLALEDRQSADNSPKQRRWVRLAHGVLGIRSIQDELLIKQ